MEIEVQQRLVHNIYKIMRDRKLTQVAVAGYMGPFWNNRRIFKNIWR